MNSAKKVRFDDDMLENMEIETSIFSPVHPELGVAVLSEKKDGMFIVHILELAKDEDAFFPIQELASFSFSTKREMKDFVKQLPDMSGLEMLLLLNPMPRTEEKK
ncbi:hypothetical protein [Virgibacillus kimchii]